VNTTLPETNKQTIFQYRPCSQIKERISVRQINYGELKLKEELGKFIKQRNIGRLCSME
jgi:hypothetical protein